MSNTNEKTPDSPAETQSGGRVGLSSDAASKASAAQRAEAYLKTIGKWQQETSRKLGARKPCPVTLIMDDEGAITELDNNSSREDGAN